MTHLRARALEVLEPRRLLAAAAVTAEPTPAAIVVGSVFRDANGNGVRESTEHGQSGARVYLDYNGNGTRDGDAEPIAIANADGVYRFASAKAGAAVRVRLLLAGTNFVQTFPTHNAARVVTPVAGKTTEAERFGVNEPVVTPPPPAPTTAVVEGTVFRDANKNGTRDAAEAGQANVKVFLDYNANGVRDGDAEPIAVTTAAGAYRFEKVKPTTNLNVRLLLAGTKLVQSRPANNAARVVTVAAGQALNVASFGVYESVVAPPPMPTPVVTTLSGRVFTDLNRNGGPNSNEHGRAGVKVFLDLNKNGTREDGEPIAVTDATGTYRFERVAAGEATIGLLLAGTNLYQSTPADGAELRRIVVAGKANVVVDLFGVAERLPTATA